MSPVLTIQFCGPNLPETVTVWLTGSWDPRPLSCILLSWMKLNPAFRGIDQVRKVRKCLEQVKFKKEQQAKTRGMIICHQPTRSNHSLTKPDQCTCRSETETPKMIGVPGFTIKILETSEDLWLDWGKRIHLFPLNEMVLENFDLPTKIWGFDDRAWILTRDCALITN